MTTTHFDDDAILAMDGTDLEAVSGGTFGLLFGLLSFKSSLFYRRPSSCAPAPTCSPCAPAPAPKGCYPH